MERLPFKENIKDTSISGNFSNLYEFENNPRFVVKESKFATDNVLDDATIEKNANSRVREMLGDEVVPKANFIIGEKDGRKTFFVVQEKVIGHELSDETGRDHLKEEAIKMSLQSIVLKVLDDYMNSYSEEKTSGSLLDLISANIMIGHKYEEKENKVYFVDTTNPFVEVRPHDAVSIVKDFMRDVGITSQEIEDKLLEIANLDDHFRPY